MVEEEKKKDVEKGVSRREFLTGAGVVLGSATLGTEPSFAPEKQMLGEFPPRIEIKYTCPLDGHYFATFEDLKGHFTTAHPQAVAPTVTKLKVNGTDYDVQIEPQWTLQRTLQFKLGLTGAKTMCDRGECGSCAVIVDGKAVLSCTTLAVECEGKSIETIEGIAANPKWAPLVQAYTKYDAMQCGYCTPGFLVTAKALLDRNPNPTEEAVKQALAGNICRCGTYVRHPKAVLEAAQALRGGK